MASYRYVILFVVAVFGSLQGAHGISDESKAKIKELLLPTVIGCATELKVDNDTLKSFKGTKELPDDTSACFFACVFKKIGFMDENGLYLEEASLERSLHLAENDEEKAKFTEKAKACGSVNTEAVSDGEKGCDRARLLYACMKEQAAKLGLYEPSFE